VSDDLPTVRSNFPTHDLIAICPECHHSIRVDQQALLDSGKGDVPLIKLRFRCTKCGHVPADIKVSGGKGMKPW
jgi:Zn finger protein HypA/HybF involved in hydrogenase expression